jgi:hypothetical protein
MSAPSCAVSSCYPRRNWRRTESTTRGQAEHFLDSAERFSDDEANVGLVLDTVVEHLRRSLSTLVCAILVALLVLLLFRLGIVSALRLDLCDPRRLLSLLLQRVCSPRHVEPDLRDLISRRPDPLLPRQRVFVDRGRGLRRGELESDFGLGNGRVGDGREGERECWLARYEECQVLGYDAGGEVSATRERTQMGDVHWTSATPQFHPRTLMSLVSMFLS